MLSYFARLAEERQAAAEQGPKQSAAEDKRQKMLDSLRGAGVENFTMRAAVPGTEVPGHKVPGAVTKDPGCFVFSVSVGVLICPSLQNWVVSKFGRVLPVLQLSQQKGIKVRSMKYDPSKYSHNIHRLDQSSQETATPVTHLTWELQGGDSDISRKRRGEFPPFHPGPKRSCTDKAANGGRHQAQTR